MKSDLYVYKMVTDNGGAPCVWRGLLSLAICKPMIRRSAEEGDIVFGFGAKNYGERLLYIAEVTEKLSQGRYYRDPAFGARPDCIYQEDATGGPLRKPTAVYHTLRDHRGHDVGMSFERADVLLSRNFRYLGSKGTDDFKQRYATVKEFVERLKRGHRVNHSVELRNELLRLKAEVWAENSAQKIGSPSDGDRGKPCNSDSPSARC